jgi:hypothetical protein
MGLELFTSPMQVHIYTCAFDMLHNTCTHAMSYLPVCQQLESLVQLLMLRQCYQRTLSCLLSKTAPDKQYTQQVSEYQKS